MTNHGLTKENLLSTFPASLRENPSIAALGDVTMEALSKRPVEISRLSIYPRIDELPEELLDILAHDFKVDWWDPNYTIEEKRRTLKGSWRVHKTLGTKAAIETALRAVYPKARAEPWFEYEGGEPYHFRIHIDLSDELWAEGKPQSVLNRVRYYQSLRDHMDSIQYTMVLPSATLRVGGAVGAIASLRVHQGPEKYDFHSAIYTGGTGGICSMMGIGEDRYMPKQTSTLQTSGTGGICSMIGIGEDKSVPKRTSTLQTSGTGGICSMIGIGEDKSVLKRTSTLHTGGATAARSSLSVYADTSPPSTTTILRTGSVCTIISNLSKGE